MAGEDYIDVAAEREKGIKRGKEEAFKEGERIYNDGFSSVTSGMNKQITKGLMYEKSAIQALEKGYKAAKEKDKNKVKKASGGAIKKVKPLTSEILSAADKRRRKDFMAKSKKPIRLRKKKVTTVMAASGGLLKSAPNKGVTKLPKDVRNKMGFMKKGGAVKKMKKCRMDGIALRGKTRAKQRSK